MGGSNKPVGEKIKDGVSDALCRSYVANADPSSSLATATTSQRTLLPAVVPTLTLAPSSRRTRAVR